MRSAFGFDQGGGIPAIVTLADIKGNYGVHDRRQRDPPRG